MLQVYSDNLTVDANTVFPFNNVVVDKGCAEALSAPATIQLNQRGVYLVHYDGFATATVGGTISTQLYVNGTAQPAAISEYEAADVAAAGSLQFETCVQVPNNNCNCNMTSSPTTLQFINNGIAIEDAHINIVVTKLC